MSDGLILDRRIEVLKDALHLERELNNIFILLFNLSKDETKVFSFSSNTFSFQQKILLLKDLNHITKDDYLCLNLFMEFRNQFMHNFYANTFFDVVNILNRKSELLKFKEQYDKKADYDLEKIFNNEEALYLFCFHNLGIKNITILYELKVKIFKNKKLELEDKISTIQLKTEIEYLKKIEEVFIATVKSLEEDIQK